MEGFVKGHDLSRAYKANEIIGALAPEGSVEGNSPKNLEFFSSMFSP